MKKITLLYSFFFGFLFSVNCQDTIRPKYTFNITEEITDTLSEKPSDSLTNIPTDSLDENNAKLLTNTFNYNNESTPGSINVHNTSSLDSLIRQQKNIKEANINGYQVQLMFTTNYSKAKEELKNFKKKYPKIPALLDWKEPNFRLRVGFCRNNMEASKLLNQLKHEYPGAYEVPVKKLPIHILNTVQKNEKNNR